jgi:hypothetical protein
MDGAFPILAVQRASIAGPDPAHDHPAIGIDDPPTLEDASRRSVIGRPVITRTVIGIGRRACDGSQSKTADHAGRNSAAVIGTPVIAVRIAITVRPARPVAVVAARPVIGGTSAAVVARGIIALSQPVGSVAIALIATPAGLGFGRNRLNGHGTDKDKARSHPSFERNAHGALQRAELL